MKKVKDFMNTRIVSFEQNDSIFKVAKAFSEKNISGAPVVKDKKIIGVISESDIVKFMSLKLGKKFDANFSNMSLLVLSFIKDFSKLKDELKRISKTKVKDVMSKRIISISPEENIFDAADLMEKKDVNRLPVVDNGELVGIITRADLIKALVK